VRDTAQLHGNWWADGNGPEGADLEWDAVDDGTTTTVTAAMGNFTVSANNTSAIWNANKLQGNAVAAGTLGWCCCGMGMDGDGADGGHCLGERDGRGGAGDDWGERGHVWV
jgi:hypothetical protein